MVPFGNVAKNAEELVHPHGFTFGGFGNATRCQTRVESEWHSGIWQSMSLCVPHKMLVVLHFSFI